MLLFRRKSIKNNVIYKRSDAALEIVKNLKGLWFLFGIFRIVPVSIRDYFYRTFANNRYRLFGKREVCMVPSSDQQKRFIQK
jgi:predicted DCC family thiol-disulfide oxidoreductase YuxK